MKTKKYKKSKLKKIIKYFLLSLLLFVLGFIIYFFQAIKMPPPKVEDLSPLNESRIELGENFYGIKNNRLRKSESGLWELYIEGEAFERGVYNGKLSKELIKKQEDAFIDEIKKMIPSQRLLNFLKYLTAWFNRNMDDHVPQEYLKEIYGISKSASEEYQYIGSNYERILNYHAAHDIGHALQNLAKIGCTSFSCVNEKSADGELIIGRNFDFYVGDTFAEDKIINFYAPNTGYKFVEITWGGFIGTVSGMNIKGLTVTLNAAKSKIPFSSADPISLIAREILQYASTIEEAYRIAKNNKAFVSEAIMIGSALDHATAIIEITPDECQLFYPESNIVIGPNHFQAEILYNTELNQQNIFESSSMYRYKRISELINQYETIDVNQAADILRNKKGLGNEEIGMGNEKNICQLISHHSVIFKPNELKVWISTNPYQLGKYVCYNLDSVFQNFPGMMRNQEIYEKNLEIPVDSFLYTDAYMKFIKFKQLKDNIKKTIDNKSYLNKEEFEIDEFIDSNPEYFYVYELSGDYFFQRKNYIKAKDFYLKALSKEITTYPEKESILEKIKRIEKQLKE